MRSSRNTALAMAGVLSLGLLAACGQGDGQGAAATSAAPGDEKVTITVAGLLPGAEQDAVDALDKRVTEFEAKYPNITVEPQEYQWLATTFAANLAGGTLPTVFEIPVTDGKTLIENGQLADIDAQVKALPYADQFNDAVVANAKGADGKFYAVPAKSFYSVALHYNRNLFTQAGLDPDKPPTTWDEVRKDAKIIHDKTGVYGYGMMALTRGVASSRRPTRTAPTPRRSTTRPWPSTSSGSRRCAGRTTPSTRTARSAGRRSTRRSAAASWPCTPPAPTSTRRWCRTRP